MQNIMKEINLLWYHTFTWCYIRFNYDINIQDCFLSWYSYNIIMGFSTYLVPRGDDNEHWVLTPFWTWKLELENWSLRFEFLPLTPCTNNMFWCSKRWWNLRSLYKEGNDLISWIYFWFLPSIEVESISSIHLKRL